MPVPIQEALAALSGEPASNKLFGREGWGSSVLTGDDSTRRGSANHRPVASLSYFAPSRENTPAAQWAETRLDIREWVLDWIAAVEREGLGLQEGPHSRIYQTWQFAPMLAWYQELRSGFKESAERLRKILRSDYALLALCTVMQKPTGYWRSTGEFDTWACAAAGARSWSEDAPSKPHHIDEFQGGGLLRYEMGGARPVQWEGDIIRAVERRFGMAQFLTSAERSVFRAVLNDDFSAVPDLLALVTVPAYAQTEYRYLGGPGWRACVAIEPDPTVSTSPLLGCLYRRSVGKYELLAAHPLARNRASNSFAEIVGNTALATLEAGGNQAPDLRNPAGGSVRGPLLLPPDRMFHAAFTRQGARLFGQAAPPAPSLDPPQPPPVEPSPPVTVAASAGEIAYLAALLAAYDAGASHEIAPLRNPSIRATFDLIRARLERLEGE